MEFCCQRKAAKERRTCKARLDVDMSAGALQALRYVVQFVSGWLLRCSSQHRDTVLSNMSSKKSEKGEGRREKGEWGS